MASVDLSHEIAALRQVFTLGLERLDMIETRLQFQKETQKEEWITTPEAAKISGINQSTLTRYALTEQVECKRVGGRWYFPRTKVEDLSFVKTGRDAR
ncbi:MAG: helix-turn-helix domain-containing protein [Sphaerochaeta sp.]|nr:helix-turn-helix domain-containing protein [Sphaerochaeta sp.]